MTAVQCITMHNLFQQKSRKNVGRRRRDVPINIMGLVIDDSVAYIRPWAIVSDFTLQADTEVLEFICEDNNVAAEHIIP